MHSNKSSPVKIRVALTPQRRHGRLRVAALLDAAAAVMAEKGFQAATMAEIASRAGAPIGSLYRFFPNKEILADALLQRFVELVDEAFEDIDRRIKLLSLGELAEALLNLMVDLQGERLAIRALLEAHSDWSQKRAEFRKAVRRHLAKTLLLRSPRLSPRLARDMAVILLQNMKAAGLLNRELRGEQLSGACLQLRDMTRLYLADKLKR